MANEQTSVPLFVADTILTAAQQNISAGTGVPVFATTVTRDAAFGGANKALAEGQLCYLSASNIVQYYDGAAWATVGPASASPIVQVVFASYATETTTTSTTYVTAGLTATITPTLNTSKVLVMATCVVQNFNSQDVFATVFRGTVAGTNLYGAAGFLVSNEDSGESRGGGAGNFLDSPATTSATTYTLGFKSETANVSKIQVQNTTSTLVLMEVLV